MNKDEKKQQLKTLLWGALREKCAAITKAEGRISYNEGKNIVAFVEMVFVKRLGFVPKPILSACELALVFVAPSTREKAKILKSLHTTAAGLAGISSIITGVGLACGWGSGIIAAVIAWFAGTSMLGPLALITIGASAVICAGYFHFSSNDVTQAERFEKSLRGGLDKAIDQIWGEYGDKISANSQNAGVANVFQDTSGTHSSTSVSTSDSQNAGFKNIFREG